MSREELITESDYLLEGYKFYLNRSKETLRVAIDKDSNNVEIHNEISDKYYTLSEKYIERHFEINNKLNNNNK